MSSLFYSIKENNVCRMCRHEKDRFKDACFCTQYGIIVSYGKTACKAYKPKQKKEVTA